MRLNGHRVSFCELRWESPTGWATMALLHGNDRGYRRGTHRAFVARIRSRLPSYGVEDFLRAFRFASDMESVLRRSARHIGFD